MACMCRAACDSVQCWRDCLGAVEYAISLIGFVFGGVGLLVLIVHLFVCVFVCAFVCAFLSNDSQCRILCKHGN